MSDEELPFTEVLARIGELAEELTSWPDPAVATRVGELLDWIDAFHRDGLGQLVEMTRAWRGEIFLEAVAADEHAGALLAAYGLGEAPGLRDEAMSDVDAALVDVRPMVQSHGGSIEIDDVTDGVVRVRLNGTCDGCPSSSATLTYGVEAALRENWPSFRRLEVVDAPVEVDPAKAGLTCGLPAPEIPSSKSPSSSAPGPVPVQLTRRPGR
ncbi:MAG TPA: NifU family protein [Acidimicrobiales bacterium]|nr:NifU family protein [Acidimicrobiales bacterium]